jgi:phytoene dehydrogenase-like protein
MGKSIIIIGAGISGLATGCYGQMNGYDTRIYEMNSTPGGLCAAWQLGGYTFDCGAQWLDGTKTGSGLYKIWQELGLLRGSQVKYMDELYRFQDSSGAIFHCYTDTRRLEKHLLEVAPEDVVVIKELIQGIKRMTGFPVLIDKAPEIGSIFDGLKAAARMTSYTSVYKYWRSVTVGEFADRFKSLLLQQAFKVFWCEELAMVFVLITLAEFGKKSAGYPIGGASGLITAIVKRYQELGGNITCNARVEKILVDNDKATGIKLADGSAQRADYVLSACDVHMTAYDLLDARYIDDRIPRSFNQRPVDPPLIFTGIGVSRSFKDIPEIISGMVLPLVSPVKTGDCEAVWLTLRIQNFDSARAPDGKTVMTATIPSHFEYWALLHKNISEYNAAKAKIGGIVTATLEKHFPGIGQEIEILDIATPDTIFRRTNSWHGSFSGWLANPRYANVYMSKRLPGLDNMLMVSKWVQPRGSVAAAAMNGMHVIQILCKEDDKKFRTNKPV